jgi:copper resistance protein C
MSISFFRAALRSLILVAGLVAASGAFAHVALVSSTPAANSHASSAEHIDLTFNEALVPRASRITLSRINRDKSLTPVADVSITLTNDNKTIRATPQQKLSRGEYQVEWRAVGGDNHPMTGSYRFMIH